MNFLHIKGRRVYLRHSGEGDCGPQGVIFIYVTCAE